MSPGLGTPDMKEMAVSEAIYEEFGMEEGGLERFWFTPIVRLIVLDMNHT